MTLGTPRACKRVGRCGCTLCLIRVFNQREMASARWPRFSRFPIGHFEVLDLATGFGPLWPTLCPTEQKRGHNAAGVQRPPLGNRELRDGRDGQYWEAEARHKSAIAPRSSSSTTAGVLDRRRSGISVRSPGIGRRAAERYGIPGAFSRQAHAHAHPLARAHTTPYLRAHTHARTRTQSRTLA